MIGKVIRLLLSPEEPVLTRTLGLPQLLCQRWCLGHFVSSCHQRRAEISAHSSAESKRLTEGLEAGYLGAGSGRGQSPAQRGP